jgi:hypothetical protein
MSRMDTLNWKKFKKQQIETCKNSELIDRESAYEFK